MRRGPSWWQALSARSSASTVQASPRRDVVPQAREQRAQRVQLGVGEPAGQRGVKALGDRPQPLECGVPRRGQLHQVHAPVAQRFDATLRGGFTDAELYTLRALLARLRDNVAPG